MLNEIFEKKKPLYKLVPSVVVMDVKLAIMTNGNQYELIWDGDNQVHEEFFRMIDLEKGWVELKMNSISEIIDKGQLKDKKIVHPKIRELILQQYGEGAFA